jgi:hypothetical protein
MPRKRTAKVHDARLAAAPKMPDPVVDRPKQTMEQFLTERYGKELLWRVFGNEPAGYLRKRDFTFEDSVSEEARKAWAESKDRWLDKQIPLHIRTLGHIHRLTRSCSEERTDWNQVPIAAEMEFGIAMLRHFPAAIHSRGEMARKIAKEVMEEEHKQTKMFWTVAPYVFKHLKAAGVADAVAIQKIIDWASEPADKDLKDIRSIKEALNEERLILKGFTILLVPFYLRTSDPEDLSHKVADSMAEYIVTNYLLLNAKS